MNTENAPQKEFAAEQEIMPQCELSPELEKTLVENLEIENVHVLNKHTVVSKKTLKIPLSALVKIQNSRASINRESATLVDFPNNNHQIYKELEQEEVSQTEHNIEMENILELDTTENNLEINHANELDKRMKIRKKTIKISLNLFRKIHNIHYSSIFPHANNGNNIQPETVTKQSELNLEKESMMALDATVDNSTDENKQKIENDDNVNIKHSNNLNGHTMVRSKTLKIPISTFVEVDNFHHPQYSVVRIKIHLNLLIHPIKKDPNWIPIYLIR